MFTVMSPKPEPGKSPPEPSFMGLAQVIESKSFSFSSGDWLNTYSSFIFLAVPSGFFALVILGSPSKYPLKSCSNFLAKLVTASLILITSFLVLIKLATSK